MGGLPTRAGLLAEFFKFGQSCSIPNLYDRTPSVTRPDPIVDYSSTKHAWKGLDFKTHFAARWTGFIWIDKAGKYKFWTFSDDGSRLSVAGSVVVDNDGCNSES